ncbi:MAG: type I restriction-modification system subunit M [Acetobacter sp.]|nr:type I restriction-modification system subunit M [Acetobacter sp.]
MTETMTKKEQELTALHATIWQVANDLRGSVDGWDFKAYVLGMLFYRFISEDAANTCDMATQSDCEGETFTPYAQQLDDAVDTEEVREWFLQQKGFFIRPSELFENVCRRVAEDKDFRDNINETLTTIFQNIQRSALGHASEDAIKGLLEDIKLNDKKLGATVEERSKKIVKLLTAIEGLNFGAYSRSSIDLFGDAYEYLMAMYAENAGRSGGKFFTPQDVAELLARITVLGKDRLRNVYDPACGSGSLLLTFVKVLGGNGDKIREGFYGQEINLTTYNLCRMNMFLHGISYDKFHIVQGDTLEKWENWGGKKFDAIVSNPPYSISWNGIANPLLLNDERFSPAGVLAPKKNADLAFVMHALYCLDPHGTAAIVSFPGVLYRDGAEQTIREYLVENNYVHAVIALPDNLFFGTGIQTAILVLKKSKKDDSILFIDASKNFVRSKTKNRLTKAIIEEILQHYENRQTREGVSALVRAEQVEQQKYNLSVECYVNTQTDNEEEDIDILALNQEIAQVVAHQTAVRHEVDILVERLESGA